MPVPQPSTSLPSFIADEQVRRQVERLKAFAAMKALTQQGRHREAAELWNTITNDKKAA